MKKNFVKEIMKKLFYRLFYLRVKAEMLFKQIMALHKSKNKGAQRNIGLPDEAEQLNAVVAEVYGNRDGIMTIVSDDGFYKSGVLLNELVKKYDVCATIAGSVSIVKPHLKEWKEIIAEGCLEMVSHSYRHVALRENDEISQNWDRVFFEIVGSARWHEKKFPELGKQITYVWPEGEACRLGNEILAENGFYAVRKVCEGYNSLSPNEGTEDGKWFGLKIQGIGGDSVNTASRNEWVNEATNKHLWLIEMWHNVMEEQDGFYQTILRGEAEEHLKYISKMQKEKRIWVATLTAAVKYIREKQNTDVIAYLHEDSLFVSANYRDNTLSKEVFDHPLTVKIRLPEELRNCSYYLDTLQLPVTKEGDLLTDIVPNGQMIKIDIYSRQGKDHEKS